MSIDWAVVFATLVGPVLAVQAQKVIERRKENSNRRDRIFQALMTNRATRLSDLYVQALNQIDLEFQHSGNKKDKAVIDKWRVLFGELNAPPEPQNLPLNVAWIERCNEGLVQLLLAMSAALGRLHSEEEIRRGMYYPKGRFEAEQAQLAVLDGLKNLLNGTTRLKVEPPDPGELQLKMIGKIMGAYDESGAVRVNIISEDQSTFGVSLPKS